MSSERKMRVYVLSNTEITGAVKLPVIKIDFLKISVDLQKYDYLIFTSKNGVYAIDKICNEWKNIPSLAIGNATARKIEELGGRVEFVAKRFYGDDFAKEIAEKFDKNRKFLYLRAKEVVSNLTAVLREHGFYVEEAVVYETRCSDCKSLKKPEKNSYIIFSSPSTIRCFFKCFKWDKSYKAVAIGKKTASFIPKDIDCIVSPVQTLQGTVDFLREEKALR
ncbi:uroporphyrinogen-III synthase [Nitrosophilus alvini]|uniref:uroporphyrinogen-III synthase n=1 Tax=Nitrosophilus alvini TaxID=2714855 RepID=UPI00190DB0A8|nr:uroporphyrinogen-III synthase [Nitrosophilus alvini]